MMDLDAILKESLANSPIVWKGEYAYFVNPITDGVPRISPELMDAVIESFEKIVKWDDVDIILGIEAMGLPIAALLASRMRKPMVVARKRSYGLKGEVCVNQSTGYSKGEIYLNDINKGDRVLIVDDVLSTGGTILSIINGVKACKAIIVQIIVVFEKGKGLQNLKEQTRENFHSLIRVDMDGDKIIFP